MSVASISCDDVLELRLYSSLDSVFSRLRPIAQFFRINCGNFSSLDVERLEVEQTSRNP